MKKIKGGEGSFDVEVRLRDLQEEEEEEGKVRDERERYGTSTEMKRESDEIRVAPSVQTW